MKKVACILMLLTFLSSLGKTAPSDNSVLVGSWKCAVVDVPDEYTNSVITFVEKEGKLTGTVKFDSGEEIKLNTASLTDGQLVLTLYVEGNSITVDGKVAEQKITGTVDTPDGKVSFTASKVVEKKK